ncbi:MAG: HAL/PAL/TAL family ammonia-lyase [Dictyoglomaceae bacterium]
MAKYEFVPFGLTIEDLYELSKEPPEISISQELREKIIKSRELVEKILREEKSILRIPSKNIKELHEVGNYLSPEEVRAIMISRAYSLALGYSGVRMEVIEKILEFLRKDIIPLIPERESGGTSSDLTPLAYISYALTGMGEVLYQNKRMNTKEALRISNTQPLELEPKEGLVLINGTQFMSGIGSLCYIKAKNLGKISEIASALSLEALKGTNRAFDPWIQALRPHRGQIKSSENLRRLISESEIILSYRDCPQIRDAYILGCIPQVFAGFHQTMDFVRDILEVELNSVTDNPLIILEEEKILSGGNFHGEILAHAFDYLSIAITNITTFSERRIYRLSSNKLSELSNISASLVSENKILSQPVSSLSVVKGEEDFVNMRVESVLKLRRIIKNWETISAIELICAVQEIDSYRPLKCGRGTEIAYQYIRSLIPHIEEEEELSSKIQIIEKNLYQLLEEVEKEIGELL